MQPLSACTGCFQPNGFCYELHKCVKQLLEKLSESTFDCITCSFKSKRVEEMKQCNPLTDNFTFQEVRLPASLDRERITISFDEASPGC